LILENSLLQINNDIDKYGIARYRVTDVLKEIGLKNENFENIYWDLKIAFYNKGIILRTGLMETFEKVFIVRKKRSDDQYQKIKKGIWKGPGELELSNYVMKQMENLKIKTSKTGLEHGFYLYYKEDLKLFPGVLQEGSDESIYLKESDPEGPIIFGWIHTHSAYGLEKIDEEEKEILRLPSPTDILSAINDHLNERKYNHSVLMILFDLDDYVTMYIPRENVSDSIYKIFMDDIIISEKNNSLLDSFKITLDAIDKLFDILLFKIDYDKDVIIVYNPVTGEYGLHK
jgi:hypothetical protein